MVVFNVGGALCCYLEIDDKTVLIDAGTNNDFNPINDFLLPYFKRSGRFEVDREGKYKFGQLLISHPHHDHISLLKDFSDNFCPSLITCPNDKSEKDSSLNIDWNLFFPDGGIDKNPDAKLLKNLYQERYLPLKPFLDKGPDRQYLYFIKPGDVANNNEILSDGETYANNISLVTLFTINNYHVLFPGDIMKNGFKNLLASDNGDGVRTLRKGLNMGIDVLVAPHHGLKSAFSEEMFAELPEGKVNSLNIISEKPNNPDENREVDSRYSSSNYCKGENNLRTTNGLENNCQRKTSQGHICVDFEHNQLQIYIMNDEKDLLNWFLNSY